jgi:hypothetical protein
LLLVGDTKQHYSVQRGDALRHIVEHIRFIHQDSALPRRGRAGQLQLPI